MISGLGGVDGEARRNGAAPSVPQQRSASRSAQDVDFRLTVASVFPGDADLR